MIAPRFRRLAVLVVIGVAAAGLASCSNTITDAATLTYHDSTGSHTLHITRSSFQKELSALLASTQFQTFLKTEAGFKLTGDQKGSTGSDLTSTYLGQLIESAALNAEFSALKLTVSTNVRNEAVQETKEEFPLASEIGQDSSGNQTFIGTGIVYASFPKWLQNTLVDRAAKLDALGQYYSNASTAKEEALYNEFASTICPSGRIVAQIQVKDAATASAILTQLQGGASFSALAQTQSKDATSAKAGGTVGCLTTTTVAKEFAAAAYAAPFGTPIGPVKSSVGYHVILVTHANFGAVHAELTQALTQNPLIARDLRLQTMHVWINPLYGTGALGIDSQSGTFVYHVSPPVAPSARVCRETSADCSGTTTTTTVPAAAPVPGG